MAVERAVAKQPTVQAPKDARCYICLEEDAASASSKLMRGCACRGNSAGFAHLECLAELAESKEASGDVVAIFNAWIRCGNCKQRHGGPLGLELRRRFWRRYRSGRNPLGYDANKFLANWLAEDGEIDAVNQLLDEASTYVGNNKSALLDLNINRVKALAKNGQNLEEALERLHAILPEAKEDTAHPFQYFQAMRKYVEVLTDLDRKQEAHEASAEMAAFTKTAFGLNHENTLVARKMYASACAELGRFEESSAIIEEILTTETRIYGPDHIITQETRRYAEMVRCPVATTPPS